MMGLFEVVAFFVGTTIVSYGTYLWGYSRGECTGCAFLRRDLGLKLPAVEEFDQKVDIVCNECGLVGEFECAACNPVPCSICDKTDCTWDASVAAFLAGKA